MGRRGILPKPSRSRCPPGIVACCGPSSMCLVRRPLRGHKPPGGTVNRPYGALPSGTVNRPRLAVVFFPAHLHVQALLDRATRRPVGAGEYCGSYVGQAFQPAIPGAIPPFHCWIIVGQRYPRRCRGLSYFAPDGAASQCRVARLPASGGGNRPRLAVFGGPRRAVRGKTTPHSTS